MTATTHPQAPNTHSAEASNDAVIEHILTRFHDVHRKQLPELIRLSLRVDGRKGDVQHG